MASHPAGLSGISFLHGGPPPPPKFSCLSDKNEEPAFTKPGTSSQAMLCTGKCNLALNYPNNLCGRYHCCQHHCTEQTQASVVKPVFELAAESLVLTSPLLGLPEPANMSCAYYVPTSA